MAYQPIENYGIIGDLRSVALVCMDGSIDWLCFPHFDSPSVFAAILDDKKGGRFRISPVGGRITRKQLYWPDTNVLITRFFSSDGVGEVIDYMPVGVPETGHGHRQLIQRRRVVRGVMAFRMECFPAFDYALQGHETDITPEGACFRSPWLGLGLATRVPLKRHGDGAVAQFALQEEQTAVFVLREIEPGTGCGVYVSEAEEKELFGRTVEYWLRWLSQCTYTGRWREAVHRSALALKLLSYEPTGAIVAAPTCSLPEDAGGVRNWDYRYTWIRDAAFTLYGLLRIGFTEEAERFMRWLGAPCQESEPDGSLQLMYGIDGRSGLTEETLDHLEGCRGSRPVRIGNGAHDQLQLYIYDETMDAVYLYNKYGTPISYDLWTHLRSLINWVCDNWRREDEGIWEVRGGRRHFVCSKLMCWVALDRGLRLADKRSFPADRDRWLKVRDRIYEEIMEKGWNPERKGLVQSYGSDTLDASNLMMPLVFFLSPNDPRMLSTLDAINRSPKVGGLVSNDLVYRYDTEKSVDGLTGTEVRSACARSGSSRHSREPGGSRKPGSSSSSAGPRQPPGVVRRGNRPQRRGSGQLPPGLHAPDPDQRRLEPRPGVRNQRLNHATKNALTEEGRRDPGPAAGPTRPTTYEALRPVLASTIGSEEGAVRLLHWKLLEIVGLVLVAMIFVAGCGASGNSGGGKPESDTSGERVTIGDDAGASVWGEGDRGVVLAHGASYDAASWEPQGRTLAENGVVGVAVDDITPDSVRFAIDYLKKERGVGSVALIGASAGAGPVLRVAAEDPEEVNQVILLSGVGDVSGLGVFPKLFVASEGEGIADQVRRMAYEAPGDENEAFILSGDAHAQAIFQTEEGERLMQAILERLEEYG